MTQPIPAAHRVTWSDGVPTFHCVAELPEPPVGSVVAAGRTVFLREEDDANGAAWRKIGHLTTYGWADVLAAGDAEMIRYGLAELPDDAIEAAARAMALVDEENGCFERADEFDAITDPLEAEDYIRAHGYPHDDREDCEYWRRRARAAFEVIAARVRAEAVADDRQRIVQGIEGMRLNSADGSSQEYDDGLRTASEVAAGSVPVATPEPIEESTLLAKHAAFISRTVTASYPDQMDPELVMRRRVGKIFVESGELGDAIEGWTGENPRKGVYATREDVIKELIDCASASLCAIEYMTGDAGLSVGMVARQVIGNAQRLSESIPDRCDPDASPVATPTEPRGQADRMGGSVYDPDDEGPECGWLKGPDDTRYGCQLPGGHSGKCEAASSVPATGQEAEHG